MSENVTIVRVPEPELSAERESQLQSLLQACFPDYPNRAYFKLPPHFRYVATKDDAAVAHLGVELRIIRVGDAVLRTFGVVDLCVHENARSHGLATRLLAELTTYAQDCRIDFIILFADDERVYTRNGWVRVDSPLSWVKINEHRTIGLATDVTPHELMARPVGQLSWPTGPIDLLGHVF